MSNATITAAEAIGEAESSTDWKLEPLQHALRLPAAAGPLARVLERGEIAENMKEYDAADAAAGRAQKHFKGWSTRASRMRYAAICVGTVALLNVVGLVPGWLAQVFAVVQYGLILGGLMVTGWIAKAAPFDTWKSERARAESARIELFNRVAAAREETRAGELELLPLQLEYFRRYQLQVQQRYYRGRAEQLAAGAAAVDRWRLAIQILTILAASLALIGLAALLLSGLGFGEVRRIAESPELRTLLLTFGIVASATESHVAANALVTQDQRAAAVYLATAANLDAIVDKQLADVRAQASAGRAEAVQDFMTLVQLAMASEHQTWKQLQQAARRLRLPGLASGSSGVN